MSSRQRNQADPLRIVPSWIPRKSVVVSKMSFCGVKYLLPVPRVGQLERNCKAGCPRLTGSVQRGISLYLTDVLRPGDLGFVFASEEQKMSKLGYSPSHDRPFSLWARHHQMLFGVAKRATFDDTSLWISRANTVLQLMTQETAVPTCRCFLLDAVVSLRATM